MEALTWRDSPDGPAIELLDQTRLPHDETLLVCRDVPALVDAIRRLAVRGAPLLGIAGAYGVALAASRGEDVHAAARRLAAARPTAVNLAWAVERALRAYDAATGAGRRTAAFAAVREAQAIAREDAEASRAMAEHGLTLVPEGARILTHCNTGSLVSGGEGTAFAVAAAAHRAGRLTTLWVDETRPLLQGARLTAYEAERRGIPYALLADGAAGSLFAAGEVDLVIVGADRIARDGSVANKVGTYPLAVLARHHGVPFVVVAPTTTIDLAVRDGGEIPIEQRDAREVRELAGRPVAPCESPVYNPAFDVTPGRFVTAIVTERGVISQVNEGNLARLGQSPLTTCNDEGP